MLYLVWLVGALVALSARGPLVSMAGVVALGALVAVAWWLGR